MNTTEVKTDTSKATMETSTPLPLPAAQLLEVMIKEEDQELITLTAQELEMREAEMKRRKYEMLKEFRCDVCLKYFHRAADLKRHSVCHTGVRPYACTLCDKAFAQKPHLATHMLLHEPKRPFSCPHCDKGYTQRQKLDSHIKIIHENERPYTCDLCGKTFARPDTYKLHMKRHDGYRPYACHLCPRTFTQVYHYNNHMAVHNDTNTNICDMCNRSFADKGSLNRHLRRIHKIDTGGRNSSGFNTVKLRTSSTDGVGLTPVHCEVNLLESDHNTSSNEVSLATLSALDPSDLEPATLHSAAGHSESHSFTRRESTHSNSGTESAHLQTEFADMKARPSRGSMSDGDSDSDGQTDPLSSDDPFQSGNPNSHPSTNTVISRISSTHSKHSNAPSKNSNTSAPVERSENDTQSNIRPGSSVRPLSSGASPNSSLDREYIDPNTVEASDAEGNTSEDRPDYGEPYYYNERGAYTQPQYTSTLSDYLTQILATCRR